LGKGGLGKGGAGARDLGKVGSRTRDLGMAGDAAPEGNAAARVSARAAANGRRMLGDVGALQALRSAPSPMVALADLATEDCPACRGRDLQVGRYPAYRSPVFAGRLLLQCRACGLAWVPGDPIDLAAAHEDLSPDDDPGARAPGGPFYSDANPLWSRPVHKARDRARSQVERLADFRPFDRVLDLGAGPGLFLHFIEAHEKWAVEGDPRDRRILSEELGVGLTTLPEAALGRAGGPFDLVRATHVLEYLSRPDIAQALALIRASLAPGGLLLAEVPSGTDQLAAFAAGRRPPRARFEPQVLFFSGLALARLVRQAGFEVVAIGPCQWTAAHVPPDVLREIIGAADRPWDGPLSIIARAP
jgi:SAM-dependent methyltransferase